MNEIHPMNTTEPPTTPPEMPTSDIALAATSADPRCESGTDIATLLFRISKPM